MRSRTLLRDLAADHPLTAADLMLTLSDHGGSFTRENQHAPYERMPHFNGAEIDEHSERGGLTASSMVSDFTSDMTRKIAWHTGPNPCMAVYCEHCLSQQNGA